MIKLLRKLICDHKWDPVKLHEDNSVYGSIVEIKCKKCGGNRFLYERMISEADYPRLDREIHKLRVGRL